jgi:hypothetical protein
MGPGAAVSVGNEYIAGPEKKKEISKEKIKEKTRKDTRKPGHTCAWGKGFDRVEKMYPDPNLGQVYLVPS